MKKVISILIAAIIVFSSFAFCASAEERVIYSKASDTALLAINEEKNSSAPIKIVKATLTQNGTEQEIYLIGLVGTHTHRNQVNVVLTYFIAVFCMENGYQKLVRETIVDNIEPGASIVLVGHSLGGMVAQQIAADKTIKDHYNVIATLTAGSPYMICGSSTEGTLNRMADKSDIIPKISIASIFEPKKQFSEAMVHDGGYGIDFGAAHNKSYINPDIWGIYDALGNKGGDATISFDKSEMQLFGEVK